MKLQCNKTTGTIYSKALHNTPFQLPHIATHITQYQVLCMTSVSSNIQLVLACKDDITVSSSKCCCLKNRVAPHKEDTVLSNKVVTMGMGIDT